jgi:FixJ family two-component response regulator
LNKQIAAELDISEVTVKMHRGNIMRRALQIDKLRFGLI